MIQKHGRKWFLILSDGRTYEHATKAEADAQERAISIAKARRAGYRIPRRPKR